MFEFITSDHTLTKIKSHKDELKKKAQLTDEGFEIVLNLVLENVKIIPTTEYQNFIEDCRDDISDKDDMPVLALAIAARAEVYWYITLILMSRKK